MKIEKSKHNNFYIIIEEKDFKEKLDISILLGNRFQGVAIPKKYFDNFKKSEIYEKIKPFISIGGNILRDIKFIKY